MTVNTHTHDSHGHDHGHSHGHRHHHSHCHAPRDFGFAFALGTALNLGFVIVQVIFGYLANSTALLADAGHNLGDVFALVAAWGATVLARRPPTERYTYGLGSTSILAALGNAIFLLIAVGAIGLEAMHRLFAPQPVDSLTVAAVAAAGVAINSATAMLFFSGRKGDVNIRAAFLHLAADAAISLGVVFSSLAIWFTGALWLDSAASLVIAAIIVWTSWELLRESTNLALHGVPRGVDPARVRQFLRGQRGVTGIHDLHIWPTSTTEIALTCHLVMPAGCPDDSFLCGTADALRKSFGIAHVTLQIERGNGQPCVLEPDHVV